MAEKDRSEEPKHTIIHTGPEANELLQNAVNTLQAAFVAGKGIEDTTLTISVQNGHVKVTGDKVLVRSLADQESL